MKFQLLLVFACVIAALADDASLEKKISGELRRQFGSDHEKQKVNFLGYRCAYAWHSRISKFKLKWDGTLKCPGFDATLGRGTAKSRKDSVRYAIDNYAHQIVAKGAVSERAVDEWIANN